jgi:hypothetical protein
MRLDLPMIELLLQAGADPEALDADHLTARDRLPSRPPENVKARGRSTRTDEHQDPLSPVRLP